MENEYVRVSVNDDGTVDVVDLRSNTRYPRCGELEDVGDVGDEYNYSPPQRRGSPHHLGRRGERPSHAD